MLSVSFVENVWDAEADDRDNDIEETADDRATSSNHRRKIGNYIFRQWFVRTEECLSPYRFE